MLKVKALSLAVLASLSYSSAVYASEQSEAKGFVEGAEGTVTLRNGWLYRNKLETGVKDQNSWGQAALVNIDSGFTKGVVGFGAGVTGDWAFKIGENDKAANGMLANNGERDQWTRGGGYVKARVSNTTVKYGVHNLDTPILASSNSRLTPEYFTGTLLQSKEIKDLKLTAGYFTKLQTSNDVNTDSAHLDEALIYGADYKVNDRLNVAYYGSNLKDALDRHYANINYGIPLQDNAKLTLDARGYHTKYDEKVRGNMGMIPPNANATGELTNNIFAVSGTYDKGPHSLTLAYQQNSGDTGYDYGIAGDGAGTIYLPNSYLSDFNAADEKSVGVHYTHDFSAKVPGLTWSTAYVYGWDIDTNNPISGSADNAKEQELFNQIKYTVQDGKAKGLNVRVRNSIYRGDSHYNSQNYIGDTNEWRVFVEYPIKLF